MELTFDVSDLQVDTEAELRTIHPDWPEDALNQVWAQRHEIEKEHIQRLTDPILRRKVEFRYFKSGIKAE